MSLDINNSISVSEAGTDFSKAARLADKNGAVVILKDNAPRYVLIQVSETEAVRFADADDVMRISKELIQKNKKLYEELAK